MHCTEHQAARTRLLRSFAAAALSVSALLLIPAANAQMNPPQARPQVQSPQMQPPQTQSPSPPISDDKLNAAAYCLTGECSSDTERCLTARVPVASLISRPGNSSPFSILNQCLLMLALWSCGRRGSVVQAQRQIHRACGNARVIKPSMVSAPQI